MTFNLENIRKMMGWCPQKDFELMQTRKNCSQDVGYTNLNPIRVNNELIDRMDVPVQILIGRLDATVLIFGRRAWTIFLGSIVLAFVGLFLVATLQTGIRIYMSLYLLSLFVFIFAFEQTKLSVSRDILRIIQPIFGEIKISKNCIENIETNDNYANRHRLRNSIALIVMIVLSAYRAITMTQIQVMNILYISAPFIFLYILYVAIQRSYYPKTIKMKVKMKAGYVDILFYPRNEYDFLLLKNIAPEKMEQYGGEL